jgi:hypothetical protein
MRYNDDQLLTDFVDRSLEELPRAWRDAASVSNMNTRLTVDQLAEFSREVQQLADRYVRANRDQRTPGARPVHITFNAFPVIDGDVSPGPESGS